MLLLVPPHPGLFSPTEFGQLYPALRGVIIATANYSAVKGEAGPMAPLSWMRSALAALKPPPEAMGKLIAAVPMGVVTLSNLPLLHSAPMRTAHRALHIAHCALRTAHCALHTAHCAPRTAHCALRTTRCALCDAYCALRLGGRVFYLTPLLCRCPCHCPSPSPSPSLCH